MHINIDKILKNIYSYNIYFKCVCVCLKFIHAKESASLKMFFQESWIRGKPAFALK